MGDLRKLKVAVGQPELSLGSPAFNEAVKDRMIAMAVDAGAALLILPGSFMDASDIHLIALNDTRIDLAGGVVIVEAAGDSYQIGLGVKPQACDFSVFVDTQPWSLKNKEKTSWPGIVLRPVGMRNVDKKVFAYDGGTAVYSNEGKLLARMRDDFEEDFAVITLDSSTQGPVAEPCKDKLLAALVKTIRRFDQQILDWSPKWIIGLSGGLDSSIVAALLVLALGPERVKGYSLQSKFSSEATTSNALYLAEALGIECKAGSIESLVDATLASAASFSYSQEDLGGLVRENVQARVRGQLLQTFAGAEGGVVANSGNRIECALGYATMYGDAIGALGPIAELTKTRLFSLAHTINGDTQTGAAGEIVPANLLPRETDTGYEWQTMPSAELAEAQYDPMKWFYHDWLLEQLLDSPSIDVGACGVLSRYLDGSLLEGEMGKWLRFYNIASAAAFLEDFEWVLKTMQASTFKRIQAPPAIAIASPASIEASLESQGPKEPSERFKELRARILKRI